MGTVRPAMATTTAAVEPANVRGSDDPPAAAPSQAQLRIVLQTLLVVGAIALSLWVLQRIAAVGFILIAAALFAYVIAPLVDLAQHPVRLAGRGRHLPRAAAIGLVYLLIAASVGGATVLLLPSALRQADDAIARIPAGAQSVLVWEQGWSRYYERLKIPRQLRQGIDASAAAANESMLASGRRQLEAIASKVTALPWLVMIPVLAFFLLKDAGSIRRIIIVGLPFRFRLRGHRLFDDLNATLAAYVRAQLLACVLVGVTCGIGFVVLGVPYPVLLGVMAGALEFIPMVGPFLLACAATIAALIHAPVTAIQTVVFLAILRVVEDYVIYPRLIRRGLELHPLAVIVGVMAGAELDGVLGMFLAVPTVATGTVIVRHLQLWRAFDAKADAELADG
jgi:predicted PurR-regulated permease PerM